MKSYYEFNYAQEAGLGSTLLKITKTSQRIDRKRGQIVDYFKSLSANKGWQREIDKIDKGLGKEAGKLMVTLIKGGSKKAWTIGKEFIDGKLTKDEALHALQEEKTFMEKHGLLVGVGGTVGATGLGYAAWRHHKKKEAEKDYADYVDWGDSP